MNVSLIIKWHGESLNFDFVLISSISFEHLIWNILLNVNLWKDKKKTNFTEIMNEYFLKKITLFKDQKKIKKLRIYL